jgi:hypothetical protein
MEDVEDVTRSHREAVNSLYEKHDGAEFNSEKDLIFSPPQRLWTLADMELQNNDSVSSFAISANFPLFSPGAMNNMRRELLNYEVRQKFGKSSSSKDRQLGGPVPKCVHLPKLRTRLTDRTGQLCKFYKECLEPPQHTCRDLQSHRSRRRSGHGYGTISCQHLH